ncbi:MAG: motility-associated protein, partial [Nitrospirota bacterium]
MDIATILGIVLALGSIIGGQILEGGHLGSIMQLTAFIIVMGGTIGAVCVQNPMLVVLKGVFLLKLGFIDPKHDNKGIIKTIIDLANV